VKGRRGAFLSDPEEDVRHDCYQLAQRLKSSGMTDLQIMDVMSFLKDPRVYDAISRDLDIDDEYLESLSEEEYDEWIASLYVEAYGVAPDDGKVYRPKTFVEATMSEAEPGAKARVVNTLAYVEGERQRDTTYDKDWFEDYYEKHAVTELAAVMTTAYPCLEAFESEEFEQRPKSAQVEQLAQVVDELLVDYENGGKHDHPAPEPIDGIKILNSFGPMYGLDKGAVRVKAEHYDLVQGRKLPEGVKYTTEVRANDYLYATEVTLVGLLKEGYRRFANEKPIFLPGCAIDRVRGWWIGVYPSNFVVPEAKPKVEDDWNSGAEPDWVVKYQQGLAAKEAEARGEGIAVAGNAVSTESTSSGGLMSGGVKDFDELGTSDNLVQGEVVHQMFVIPPLILWMYGKLRAAPGKAYYLSRRHRRATFAFSRKLKKMTAYNTVKPIVETTNYGEGVAEKLQPECRPPVAPPKEGDKLRAFEKVFYDRLTKVKLIKLGMATTADLSIVDEYRGKGKSALTKCVREGTGPSCTFVELYQEVTQNIEQRMHREPTTGELCAFTVELLSLYSLNGDTLIRN